MNWEMLEDKELSLLFDLLPGNVQEGILCYMYDYVINEDDEVIQLARMDLRDALYAYTEINPQAEKSINSRVEVSANDNTSFQFIDRCRSISRLTKSGKEGMLYMPHKRQICCLHKKALMAKSYYYSSSFSFALVLCVKQFDVDNRRNTL